MLSAKNRIRTLRGLNWSWGLKFVGGRGLGKGAKKVVVTAIWILKFRGKKGNQRRVDNWAKKDRRVPKEAMTQRLVTVNFERWRVKFSGLYSPGGQPRRTSALLNPRRGLKLSQGGNPDGEKKKDDKGGPWGLVRN